MSNPETHAPLPVCGIGASAGGVEALQQFFGALPDDLGLAYVVVVHLAPDHKSELPAILAHRTRMPVIQVGDHNKAPLAPNHVYVIAPDRKLEITDSSVGASAFEQPRGRRTAIDLFFRSLAAAHGDGFAVILSGTGTDGTLGARAVKERGGVILVQDPQEAAYGDMPQAVIDTGAADLVLPVQELAARLAELSRDKSRLAAFVRASDPDAMSGEEERALKSVLDIVRKRTGHDFTKYKRSTLLRRLSRRMQLARQLSIGDYLKHLRSDIAEVRALLDDFLISVTTFFRDAEAWSALQAQVIGPLVDRMEPDEQIRAWVPGCATGEEAYSLAMLLDEECTRRGIEGNFLVFASDLDEGALAVAREGIYPQAISVDVSEARLERYFVPDEDHYRVTSTLRDRLVFATHSVMRDPPFSRLHLVSCRNLLIYLDRDLQAQVMSIFRYACRDDGFLFLGASESADEDLFTPLDKRHRIFGARPRPDDSRAMLPEILSTPAGRLLRYGRETRPGQAQKSSAGELHLAALEEVAPPTVLIDERWNVLHLSPSASQYFQQGGGAPARRVTDLVRPELRDELHAVVHRAFEHSGAHLSEFVHVTFNGAPHRVAALAQQRSGGDDGRQAALITFLDAGEAVRETPVSDSEPSSELVRSLREKLRQAEQRIESMRDDHYLINEDLRAANEELQSLNEEYRSTTEELETSKEELQSINEELHTVNLELKAKLEEVARANSDLENLMAATNVATLFLNPDLRIKRFTPQLADVFNVRSRDLDRPIGDLTHTLDYQTLEQDARRVLSSLTSVEREAVSRAGRSYAVGLYPYRTAASYDVDGVVITFIDITEIKRAESALRESEHRLEAELNVMRRLHRMTMQVATAPSTSEALDHVLAAAIDLHGADFGNIQLLDPTQQHLRIVAHRGFRPSFLQEFAAVSSDDDTACGRALSSGRVVHIEDVTLDAAYQPYRAAAQEAGYRAVQSTPLIGGSQEMVGVLSVHFREPHAFTERDRQFADVLGRQASALIASHAQQDRWRELNEVLSRRTHDLETSQEQLSRQAADLLEQDRNRQDFLAALGHELRNPMAAIFSSLALVSDADERSRRALAVLRRQAEHMTRLINDLLDVSRVTHGQIRLERAAVDVNECVTAAADGVRPEAEAKGLRLVYERPASPLSVHADRERLTQVLDNLLRNAVTYTDAGAVTIGVQQDGLMVRFSVTDTGIGIASADVRTLFEPYQRGQDGVRGSGLGLGLTLVRGLVEAHGGTIEVRSDGRGRGSVFTFTVPLAQAPPEAALQGEVASPPSLRVLVVDDQQDVADMFGWLLETLGQDVHVAYSGASALVSAREHRPQAAFLDVSMPDMSGAEVARKLREHFSRSELTIIALTGHDPQRVQVQDGPFDHHLLKPATVESVVAILSETALRHSIAPDA